MKKKTKLMDKDEIYDFALQFCDEGCRSIVECGCIGKVRPRTKALYQYNTTDVDKMMLKDVQSSLTYLRSRERSDDLPFTMIEKDGWVWFDKRKD